MRLSFSRPRFFTIVCALILCGDLSIATAQRPDFGGGSRDGGFGGGPGGGRGGPGGRSGRGGGPPGGGGEGRGGGFGGGPPGGGFGGGPSGGRSSRGGGGMDPSSFLSRLDRNGDGKITPDEQQGPASFLIQRLQSIDPKIKAGEEISLKRVTKAFEDMRAGRSGGDDEGRRDDRGGDDRRRSSSEPDPIEPLVPGFGLEEIYEPILGFGPSAEAMGVSVTEEDRREARSALARYDRDKDGQINAKEISEGRFWGSPMDFDRNRDSKLSETELAVRHAVRRESEESQRSDKDGDQRSKRDRDSQSSGEPEDFEGRRSYRVSAPGLPEGLPRFYSERDLNGDGQVVMSEYTSDWSDARIAEFYVWDSNRDGVITLDEVRAGVNRGAVASSAPAGRMPESSSVVARSSSPSSGSSAAPAQPSEKLAMPTEPPSQKLVDRAKNIIGKYDKNGDMALTASEWGEMLISPASADFNGDGRVTVPEYAGYWQLKSKKLKR